MDSAVDSRGAGRLRKEEVDAMKLRDFTGTDFPELNGTMGGALGDIDVTGLSADSRQITPGMAFIAVSGTKADGAAFIADAAARGASVIFAAHAADAGSVPVLAV